MSINLLKTILLIYGFNTCFIINAQTAGFDKDLFFKMSDSARRNFDNGIAEIGIKQSIKVFEMDYPEKMFNASIQSLGELALRAAIYFQDIDQIMFFKNVFDKHNKDKENVIISRFAALIVGIFKRDYETSISGLKKMEEEGGIRKTGFARFGLAYAYTLKADIKAADLYIDKTIKHPSWTKSDLRYLFAVNEYNKQNYPDVIDIVNTELKPKKILGSFRPVRNRHLYFTIRAKTYVEMKEYDKARNDFEAALIYSPEYEPALVGLAHLEGKISAERKTDKTPPVINITEPVFRGIIIETSTGELMVKGFAQDPAGLKSVTINGEKAYSQEGGDFWGNVVLREGTNKVVITATDFSGNIAEKVVEVNRAVGSSAAKAVQVKEGKNYALLIGCQNYNDNKIPSLEDPIPDAVKLKLILKNNYNFTDDNLFTLFNPEVSDFKKQFLEIYEVIQPEDKLVIFYAGHGIWNEKEKKGYWMLTDAKLDDPNTWLPNKTVLDMIARVPARHTLLITDACFSGSVFRTRGLDLGKKDEANPSMVQRMNEKISRVAITSGNDTEVPDKSVFMKYLVKALSENKEKYLTAQKMFINQIIEAVMTETKTEPRYGTLELAGHVGGDFIFIRK